MFGHYFYKSDEKFEYKELPVLKCSREPDTAQSVTWLAACVQGVWVPLIKGEGICSEPGQILKRISV